ncbi:MAG TPA: hypothetical protein VK186_10520 [Candidatus Deferrimicrobium sp.]|nr:hypothetical protein [Candidatus Kapabacteria bacterium]HLP59256.1 hypothetical protein [Candidatus Deferrimicrobium sp.]
MKIKLLATGKLRKADKHGQFSCFSGGKASIPDALGGYLSIAPYQAYA